MAAKKAVKSPAPKAKKPSAPKPKTSLSKAQQAELLGLDDSFDAPIDRPVAIIVQEARDLEGVVSKVGKQLLAKSRLDKATMLSLAPRREILDRAEAAWTAHRAASIPKDAKTVRAGAEELKDDMIAALRHFCDEDAAVQRRVDAIIPGTGIPDLVDDLKKLAELVDENAAALKKADLPKDAAKQARAYAESLSRGAADRVIDPDGALAMALRNRAYWWLRGAMDDVRTAGRYVARKEPKLLAAFRATSTQARARSSSHKKEEEDKPKAAPTAPAKDAAAPAPKDPPPAPKDPPPAKDAAPPAPKDPPPAP